MAASIASEVEGFPDSPAPSSTLSARTGTHNPAYTPQPDRANSGSSSDDMGFYASRSSAAVMAALGRTDSKLGILQKSPARPARPPRTNTHISCERCRTRKTRCSGDGRNPCPFCFKRNLSHSCIYSRTRRRDDAKPVAGTLADQSTKVDLARPAEVSKVDSGYARRNDGTRPDAYLPFPTQRNLRQSYGYAGAYPPHFPPFAQGYHMPMRCGYYGYSPAFRPPQAEVPVIEVHVPRADFDAASALSSLASNVSSSGSSGSGSRWTEPGSGHSKWMETVLIDDDGWSSRGFI